MFQAGEKRAQEESGELLGVKDKGVPNPYTQELLAEMASWEPHFVERNGYLLYLSVQTHTFLSNLIRETETDTINRGCDFPFFPATQESAAAAFAPASGAVAVPEPGRWDRARPPPAGDGDVARGGKARALLLGDLAQVGDLHRWT